MGLFKIKTGKYKNKLVIGKYTHPLNVKTMYGNFFHTTVKEISSKWVDIANIEEKETFAIVAWSSDNYDEHGKIIAFVNKKDGYVHYDDKEAESDKYAQFVIDRVLKKLKEKYYG